MIPVAPLEAFPNCELVADLRMLTDEERLHVRLDGLGSSDIAAARGLSKYETPLELWRQKTRRDPIDASTNEAAFWGHQLEESIASVFADRYGAQLYQVPYILRSKSEPWKMASCDYAIDPSGNMELEIVECKNRRHPFEVVPADILDQVHWQRHVTGLATAHLVVLFAGQDLAPQWTVTANPEREQIILEAANEFWAHVCMDEPPPMMAHDTKFVIPDDGSEIVLDDDSIELVRSHVALRAAIKQATEERDKIGDQLRLVLCDAEVAHTEGGRRVAATYKPNAKGTRTLLTKDI